MLYAFPSLLQLRCDSKERSEIEKFKELFPEDPSLFSEPKLKVMRNRDGEKQLKIAIKMRYLDIQKRSPMILRTPATIRR
jgi:hypothetical protein